MASSASLWREHKSNRVCAVCAESMSRMAPLFHPVNLFYNISQGEEKREKPVASRSSVYGMFRMLLCFAGAFLDPVTHMMTGACLSRAGLNRKTGLATLTLVLALEAPDIDSLSYLGGGITGLQYHRGITHSL